MIPNLAISVIIFISTKSMTAFFVQLDSSFGTINNK